MVVNLIRGDGQLVNLWQDGLKRRSACLELEEKYRLTGTSPAGLGEGSLSRREVEQVRNGRVATVTDLTRHRVSTTVRAVSTGARSEPEFVERLRGEGLIVRPRLDKSKSGHVVGYSVAARGGDADGKLVWYGGGTLGKDLRLPALRSKWQQTADQRTAQQVRGRRRRSFVVRPNRRTWPVHPPLCRQRRACSSGCRTVISSPGTELPPIRPACSPRRPLPRPTTGCGAP
jgi:hypothetical protein